jgi:sodium/proline symporter
MFKGSIYIIVIVVYFLVLIIFGLYNGKKVKNNKDYVIAGRKLPGWIAALSERATGESSWCLLGLPGFAYASGLSGIWPALGCVLGIFSAWTALAWRLRDEAEKYDIRTFSGYISKKHGDAGKWIGIVSSFTIVFFFFFYTGAQFLGGGKVLHVLFGISPIYGILITAVVILPYSVYGGFLSLVYNDIIQALLMVIALVITPIVGIVYLLYTKDHIFASTIIQGLKVAGPQYCSFTKLATGFSGGVMIASGFSWFFGYQGGLPQLTTRFMAIKNKREAHIARNVGILWTTLAYIGAIAIGWIGIAIFGPHGLKDPETVMPQVLIRIFPTAISAIIVVGVISALLSTASSLLVLSSTELSDNLLKHIKGFNNENKSLSYSRGVTGLLAVIALCMSYFTSSALIFTLVGYVWAGIGGTFSIVILLSLFWKPYHGRAVLITIIFGLFFTIFWISSGLDKVISSKLMTFILTFIVAVIATYIIPHKKHCLLPSQSENS